MIKVHVIITNLKSRYKPDMKVSSPDRAHLDLRGTPCLVKHTGPPSACQSEIYHPKGRYSVKPAKKNQCQTSGSVSNQKVNTGDSRWLKL